MIKHILRGLIDLSGRVLARPSDSSPPARGQSVCRYPLDELEWALSGGEPMPPDHSPWEEWSGPLHIPLSLYEAIRAGGLFLHPGGEFSAILEAFADGHTSTYRDGRVELLSRMRSLGNRGFLISPSGIAVSHPRRPIVLPVSETTITICMAETPIELGRHDGPAVRVLISVVSPRVDTFLATSARLSRLLSSDLFRQLLDRDHTCDEIMDYVWLHDCGLADEESRVPTGLKD
jgi:hypothetical protein